MWGVVARIAAAAAVLTLVQHNISQMYKAYYDERMNCLLYTSPSPRDS